MCVFAKGNAKSSKTIILSVVTRHPKKPGKIAHMVGYQNAVESVGANAMLVHVPTRVHMDESNFLDTSKCPKILKDMSELLPDGLEHKGSAKSLGRSLSPAQVFNVGLYTVVLAANATDILTALNRVPENRRPAATDIKRELLHAFACDFPGWPILLCCYNSKEMVTGSPIMFWYEPIDEDMLFLPGLDSHTGAPYQAGSVPRDHILLVGMTETCALPGYRNSVHNLKKYSTAPEQIEAFMPDVMMGVPIKRGTQGPNGDWYVRISEVFDLTKPAPSVDDLLDPRLLKVHFPDF